MAWHPHVPSPSCPHLQTLQPHGSSSRSVPRSNGPCRWWWWSSRSCRCLANTGCHGLLTVDSLKKLLVYIDVYIVYYTKTKAIGGTHKWIDLETSPRLHSYQSPYTSQIPLGHPGSLSFGHFPCIISFRLPLSSAPTFKIPLESISKVTSIWGWPRGAGGIPPSSNLTLGWGYLRVQMNSSWEIHANYWQGWKWLQKFWWNFTESTFSGKVLQRCFQTYFIGMYIIIRTLFNYSKPNFGKASNLPNKWLSLVMGRSPWWLKLTNEESSRAVKDFLYMIGFLTVKSWMFIKYHVRWFYVMSFFGSYCWHTQYYANITNIKITWTIIHHSNPTLFQSNKFRRPS